MKKGFTLIELLVVIAIIGLLSTLAAISLNSTREQARDARRLSDVKQIRTALELYYAEAGEYPSAITAGNAISYNGEEYMNSIPSNPTPADADAAGCGGTSYTYTQTESGDSYTLQYCLARTTSGISGNTLHYATPAGMTD
jgi:general secretion pathway protein G